ncbi:MAG: phage tail tape measure protein [Gammaproteobacteria bacterium]|nr:phage tail tape measure protein [Gammaproteobacteria bacterium]
MSKKDLIIKIGSNVDGLKRGMSTAQIAITAVSAAVGATAIAAAAAVEEFRNFEAKFSDIVTLLDDASFTTKNFKQGVNDLRKGLLDLRATSGQSFDNLSKGLFDLVSAGVEAENSIDVLRISTDLALAGATDASVAVDGLTSSLNAYGYETSEAQAIAEKFFTAQKFGKTTIEELSTDFGKVAATASSMGVSFDEVLASVSAATLAGIETNEAYTGLKAVLSNIIKPSKDAADEAKRLGIEFDSSALKAKGFEGFLDSITSSAKFNGETLEKLFGSTEALNIAFALTGGQADDFTNILKELSDETKRAETFQSALAEKGNTLDQKLLKLDGSASRLKATLGEKLAPAFGDLAEGAAQSLDYMSDHVDDLAMSVDGLLGALVDASLALTDLISSSAGVQLGDPFTEVDPGKILDEMRGFQNVDAFAALIDSSQVMASGVLENFEKINEKEDELEKIRKAREEVRLSREKEIMDKKSAREAEAYAKKLEREEEQRAAQLERDDEQFEEDVARLLEKLSGIDEVEAQFSGLAELRELKKLKLKARNAEQIKKIDKATAIASMKASELSTQASIKKLQTVLSEETVVGKAIFLIRKAQAIANTISSTQQAMALARATVPPPGGDALAAKYALQGAINVGVIAATAIGAEKGGQVQGVGRGDKVHYMLEPEEIIVPQSHSKTFSQLFGNFPDLSEAPLPASGGGGELNITIGFTDDASQVLAIDQFEDTRIGVSR